jgi:Ca-activated chloride channel family protein
MVELLERWSTQRKSARVLLVIDVSGSMGDPAGDGVETKLDLAKRAAIDALDEFKADDEVGLRIFSTNLGPDQDQDFLDLLEPAPMSEQREALRTRIRDLFPQNGTPLYSVTQAAYEAALEDFDPTRINAVVLLSDGVNDDGEPDDDDEQLQQLLQTMRAGSEGQDTRPVRVFTIGYGSDADLTTLQRIGEATNAASYDASDPASITRVFTAVVSNF